MGPQGRGSSSGSSWLLHGVLAWTISESAGCARNSETFLRGKARNVQETVRHVEGGWL